MAFLIVDDDMTSCLILERWVERLGLECDIAMDGAKAVAASHVKAYDIVFMDMYMPVKNGLDASIDICRESSGHQCPFIVGMISIDSSETRQRCRNSGMGEVMCKPLTWQIFLQCIAKAGIRTTSDPAGIFAGGNPKLDARGRCTCNDTDAIARSGHQQPAFAVLNLPCCHPHFGSAHCPPPWPSSLASACCNPAARIPHAAPSRTTSSSWPRKRDLDSK